MRTRSVIVAGLAALAVLGGAIGITTLALPGGEAPAAGASTAPLAAAVREIGAVANERAASIVAEHPAMNLPADALKFRLDDPSPALADAGASFAAAAEALDAAIPEFAAAETDLVAMAPEILDRHGVLEPERGDFLDGLRQRQGQGSDTIAYFSAMRDRNQAVADLIKAKHDGANEAAGEGLRRVVAEAEQRMEAARTRMASSAEQLRNAARDG